MRENPIDWSKQQVEKLHKEWIFETTPIEF